LKKQVIEYILRVFLFIFLTGALHEKTSTPLMHATEHIFTILYEKFPFLDSSENAQILLSIMLGLFSLFMACIGVTYIFAKICGLFKKLDNLKKWQIFLIFFLISFLCYEMADIFYNYKLPHFKIMGDIGFFNIFLIPSYLFYLYLNHLTKKYPVPFEKIGYYTSIEFVKDIFNKIKHSIQTQND